MDMSFDFYIKRNLHAVEIKNKNLINKFNFNWRHTLNRKFVG